MDKLYVYLVSALLLAGVATAVSECSSAVCGDGVKDGTEQCDKGVDNGATGSGCTSDCKLVGIPVAGAQVSFSLLLDEAPGFTGSTCYDLGVDKWLLHLDGPNPDDKTLPCLQPSQLYTALTPGDFQATLTLLDKMGNPVSNPVKTPMMNVQLNQQIQLNYNFKPGDFLRQDYQGALYFLPNWGAQGATCSSASPAVTKEGAKLAKPDGTPVAGMTLDGLKLDGTFGSCFVTSGGASSQQVSGNLPWGHYGLSLYGQAGGLVAYCKKFDVFVGPGLATPTYSLVVDSTAAVDGGACP